MNTPDNNPGECSCGETAIKFAFDFSEGDIYDVCGDCSFFEDDGLEFLDYGPLVILEEF